MRVKILLFVLRLFDFISRFLGVVDHVWIYSLDGKSVQVKSSKRTNPITTYTMLSSVESNWARGVYRDISDYSTRHQILLERMTVLDSDLKAVVLMKADEDQVAVYNVNLDSTESVFLVQTISQTLPAASIDRNTWN